MAFKIPKELIGKFEYATSVGVNKIEIYTRCDYGDELAAILNAEFGPCANGFYPFESIPPQGTLTIEGRAPIAALIESGLEVRYK